MTALSDVAQIATRAAHEALHAAAAATEGNAADALTYLGLAGEDIDMAYKRLERT